jgi:hypothetical protein
MKRQQTTSAKVTVSVNTDPEDAAQFTPDTLLQRPRIITVELPASKPKAIDAISLMLQEGDWEHTVIWMTGKVQSGLSSAPRDGWSFNGTIRCDQLDRWILALQTIAREADKLGLRTPRSIPKVRFA